MAITIQIDYVLCISLGIGIGVIVSWIYHKRKNKTQANRTYYRNSYDGTQRTRTRNIVEISKPNRLEDSRMQ